MISAIEEFAPAATAAEFLALLRPSNQLWDGDIESHTGWVFRGQSRSDWKLRPAAFRFCSRNPLFSTYRRLYKNRFGGDDLQHWMEWVTPSDEIRACVPAHRWPARLRSASLHALVHAAMVRDFVLLADRAGHPTKRPEFLWHLTNRNEHPHALRSFFHGNVHQDDVAAFAIAQHHGVPTGLLDWTYNPLVAAFFAAEAIAVSGATGEHEAIAVWAVRTQLFRRDLREVRRLTVPSGQVPFLDAQDGLFTWSPDAYPWFLQHGRYPTFEDLVRAVGERSKELRLRLPILRKLTLPYAEIPTLLKLLWREEITRAHLMPTFDNVTASLRLEATWKERAF